MAISKTLEATVSQYEGGEFLPPHGETPVENPDVALVAYLAGIIDGEGTVGVISAGRGRSKKFCMSVKMTEVVIIDLLLNTLGGWKSFRPSVVKGWKDQWVWRVAGPQARDAYNTLYPYLRLKRLSVDPALDAPMNASSPN